MIMGFLREKIIIQFKFIKPMSNKVVVNLWFHWRLACFSPYMDLLGLQTIWGGTLRPGGVSHRLPPQGLHAKRKS